MVSACFLRVHISPINQRRLENFKANRRGYWSLWIFLGLFVVSLFADLLSNDKPILIRYGGSFYAPIFVSYPETAFGGDFETEAVYSDLEVQELIEEKGWIVWPFNRYSFDTVVLDLPTPAPSPPTAQNWLGTDDQGRDVVARLIYGVRISVLFGLILTILSSVIGIAAGAWQGYFGGWTDLIYQRFMEIWGSMPQLFILIILAGLLVPSFWLLLGILLLFSWMGLVGVVRAEFLRGRNFTYVLAARALGVSNSKIMFIYIIFFIISS